MFVSELGLSLSAEVKPMEWLLRGANASYCFACMHGLLRVLFLAHVINRHIPAWPQIVTLSHCAYAYSC